MLVSQVLGTDEPEELQVIIQYQSIHVLFHNPYAKEQSHRATRGDAASSLSVCPLLLTFLFFFFFSSLNRVLILRVCHCSNWRVLGGASLGAWPCYARCRASELGLCGGIRSIRYRYTAGGDGERKAAASGWRYRYMGMAYATMYLAARQRQ